MTEASGGRPTKQTPERLERLLEALREGNTRRVAAAVAGISERTFQDWVSANDELRELIEAAEAEAESSARREHRASGDEWKLDGIGVVARAAPAA